MNREVFEDISNKLNDLINACSAEYSKIESAGGIENLSIKTYNNMIDNSKQIKENMDRVLTTELYHIIGMGNLSSSQASKLFSIIRKLGSYRPFIAYTSMLNQTIHSMKEKCTYKCKFLDISLSSKFLIKT